MQFQLRSLVGTTPLFEEMKRFYPGTFSIAHRSNKAPGTVQILSVIHALFVRDKSIREAMARSIEQQSEALSSPDCDLDAAFDAIEAERSQAVLKAIDIFRNTYERSGLDIVYSDSKAPPVISHWVEQE
jgi:hypothetical protein